MAWNGAGQFIRTDGVRSGSDVHAQQKTAAVVVRADLTDVELEDIVTGLENCVALDGQTSPTANLPMNSKKHTGVLVTSGVSSRTEYASGGAVQDGTIVFAAAGGTADAITATFAPVITALVDGMELGVRASGANTIAAPTFVANGVGSALAITKFGGQALNVGDIFGAGHEVRLRYRLSATRWELLNPATSATGNLPRAYLSGLALSNNAGDATNDIDIAAGSCRDSTNVADIVVAAITKRLDAAWSVGTGNGGLDTGSIADVRYAMWAIKRPDTGVTDVLYSASFSAPTMPANYTLKRYIGSIVRLSAAIKLFTQTGDYVRYSATVADISATNPGLTAVTRAITAPPSTEADLIVGLTENTGSGFFYVSPLSATDEAATSARAQVSVETIAGAASMTAACRCFLDSSSQLRSRVGNLSDGSTVAAISTIGYWDRRGRDA